MMMLLLVGGQLANRLSPNARVVELCWARGYNSLKELATSPYTTAIVKGVVVGARSYVENFHEPTCGSGLVFTDYLLKVQLVLKGSLEASDTITIRQTGGSIHEISTVVWDDPPLCVGDTLIVFLHEYESGKYYVEAGPQGRFIVRYGLVYSLGEIYEPAEAVTRPFKTHGQNELQFVSSIESALTQG